MVTFGRVLLWTVVLVAPGGFLLLPVLAAASLHSRNGSVDARLSRRPLSRRPLLRGGLRDWLANARHSLGGLAEWFAGARRSFGGLQRYWTKS